jgi:hypothetical protein
VPTCPAGENRRGPFCKCHRRETAAPLEEKQAGSKSQLPGRPAPQRGPEEKIAMQQYDIRIRRDGGTLALTAKLPNDVQALHRARHLASERDELEVWRGVDCIYRREILPHIRHTPC